MNEVQHSSRSHARLNASSSYRWMMCPPSVKLSEQFEDRPSPYAEEGTFLHELCELKLHRYLGDMYPEHIEQALRMAMCSTIFRPTSGHPSLQEPP